MTVIVAARTKTGVVVACDSRVMSGWHVSERAVPKLWTTNGWVVGGAGLARASQAIRHHVTFPKYRPDEHDDFEKFVVTEVVTAIRNGLQGKGIVKSDAGSEQHQASLVLASVDQLAEVCPDGYVHMEPSGRLATGSGYAEALGFLGDSGPWARRDVVEAVRRASQSNGGVGGPIYAANTTRLTVEVAS